VLLLKTTLPLDNCPKANILSFTSFKGKIEMDQVCFLSYHGN